MQKLGLSICCNVEGKEVDALTNISELAEFTRGPIEKKEEVTVTRRIG